MILVVKSVPLDMLYICAEVLTGKSIPVLVAITRLPIGQGLAWISISLGAIVGTCFSVLASHRTHTMSLISFTNRLLQLSFSLTLSISLLLSIGKGVHADHGVALTVIPAFCVTLLAVPQRHSTALVSLLLSLCAFYVCTLMTTVDAGQKLSSLSLEQAMKKVHGKGTGQTTSAAAPVIALTLSEIIQRALQLFVLAFYACVQHAPTQVYFDTQHEEGQRRSCHGRPVYASHHHANYTAYSFFIGLLCAWIRVGFWSVVCFLQDHKLHLMLENENPGDWSWACCATYTTALLFSACWTATQLREQVLPRFCIDSEPVLLKYFVCIFALSTALRQHHHETPSLMFYTTDVLAGLSILTAYVTLKGSSSS